VRSDDAQQQIIYDKFIAYHQDV